MSSLPGQGHVHEATIELLPDYAVGALDPAREDEVARHLETCPSCRRELREILQIVGLFGEAPLPRPATRERFLARAWGVTSPYSEASSLQAPASQAPATTGDRHANKLRPWRNRRASLTFTLAAALILLALGLAITRINQTATGDETIARIVAEAPFHPLTEGELSPPASGVLFAVHEDQRAVLLAEGLPLLPPDQRFQVWLFDTEGARSSAGLFTPDATGRAEVLIETPRPMSNYAAIAVSAEPAGGSEAPSSPLALGGWLN